MIPRHLLIGVAALLLLVVSMGIYLRHMRQKAQELEPSSASLSPVAPPASGPTETVTLYVADDAAGTLRQRAAQIPLPGGRQQRAEELLRALLRIYQQPGAAHPLSPDADIRSIYLVDPGAAVIDLNAAFADQRDRLKRSVTEHRAISLAATNLPAMITNSPATTSLPPSATNTVPINTNPPSLIAPPPVPSVLKQP